MTVDDCLREYERVGQQIFGRRSRNPRPQVSSAIHMRTLDVGFTDVAVGSSVEKEYDLVDPSSSAITTTIKA